MHTALLSVEVGPDRGRKRYAVAYVKVAAGLRLPPSEVAIRALTAVGVRLTSFVWNLSTPLSGNDPLISAMIWRGEYAVDVVFEWRGGAALAAGAADGEPPLVKTFQYPERRVCVVEFVRASKKPQTALRELLSPLDVEVVKEWVGQRGSGFADELAAAASEHGGFVVAVAAGGEVAAAVAAAARDVGELRKQAAGLLGLARRPGA